MFRSVASLCTYACALLYLNACNAPQNENKLDSETMSADSLASPTAVDTPVSPKPRIQYLAISVKHSDSAYKDLMSRLTGDSLDIFLQLNRIDKQYIRRVDTLVIPTVFTGNLLDYSPFPSTLPLIKDVDKLFIFSYPIQAFAVYERGKLLRWGTTSMGKKSSKTPTGLHFTNWKGKRVVSTVNSNWILNYNFNIMNQYGVGWHQYELPGYPASHSCLRLFMHDAEWLYHYADMWILKGDQLIAKGNPVLVYGEYPWGERRPWLHLIENPDANNISESELNEWISPHLDIILREQEKRKQVIQASQNSETEVGSSTS